MTESDIERLPVEMHYRMYQRAHDFFIRPKSQGATPQGFFNTLVYLVKNVPLFLYTIGLLHFCTCSVIASFSLDTERRNWTELYHKGM